MCETGALRIGLTMRWRNRGNRDSMRAIRDGDAADAVAYLLTMFGSCCNFIEWQPVATFRSIVAALLVAMVLLVFVDDD